ncbi:restriction endonuclease subunit S [Paenibacillus sp. FSL K6-3166]|uniref:restriction endonuclease subunit S n=1 Tax=unclassified Paenibacillus TaxID=185978 RepID=UPI000BA072A3|nr:restriction endonuclease subunit S [Paenibacillus sp. VTT E-133291]OZQ85410.1 hypothetical protein CA598_21035 [Paenibacillus sp. VTT E-133291]
MINNNTPQVRFPSFTGDWEQRRVGDVVKMVGGATPSKANKAFWDGDIVWLSSQEIKDRYVSAGTYTITEKAVRESATKIIPAFTPLIVSRSGILARMFPITLPTVDVAINQDIKALFFDNEILDTYFCVSYLEMKETTILTSIVKTGTTVQSINMPDFEKLMISIPSIKEQRKIGNVFKKLDNLISLHQQELTTLKQTKRGFLQKMFPKEGQSVPEVRFPEFSVEWEERKLGDVIDGLYNGQTPSRARDDFWNGKINWLSSGELNRSIVESANEKITEAGQADANLRVVPKNTFVMAITGLEAAGTRGNCGILGIDTTLNQSCMAVYPNKELLSTQFLFQWYKLVGERYGIRFTQGTKQQSYNAETIKDLDICLPKVEEQLKISQFLSKLDRLITSHQRELDTLQRTKKAFLQKMLV